jgi:hypothetical protein
MASPLCRIVAVLLLLTGAADFLRFDSSDPSASMSAASTAQRGRHSQDGHRYSLPARAHSPSLPDDGCIFCGTALLNTPILMAFEPPVSEFRMTSTLVKYELSSDLRHPPPKPFLS